MSACMVAPGEGATSFGSLALRAGTVGVFAIAYMAISTGLIGFNKYLMHGSRFPYALFLGMVHMSCSFVFNCILLRFCPSLYPSLYDAERRVHIDRRLVLGVLLPIAGCFAAQLVLSNIAFMHSSVAFLQMMKESNAVLVYVFSLVLALENFSWPRGLVLLFVVAATALTIHGEVHLSYTGFTVQGVSIICESLKLTLQSHTLSATGKKLDALTYVLLIAPLVFLVLAVVLSFLSLFCPDGPEALQMPPLAALQEYRWVLLANGLLAFTMNVSHALFIKNSSAITFILTGIILKDVIIVAIGALVMNDELSGQQIVGFLLQLLGISLWSVMKSVSEETLSSLASYFPKPWKQWSGWETVWQNEDAEAMVGMELDPSTKEAMLSRISSVSSASTMVPQDFWDDESSARSCTNGSTNRL